MSKITDERLGELLQSSMAPHSMIPVEVAEIVRELRERRAVMRDMSIALERLMEAHRDVCEFQRSRVLRDDELEPEYSDAKLALTRAREMEAE